MRRDIIAIGASLGGTEALPRLLSALPPGLDAAVLIVQHMPADAPSHLPVLLNRVSSIPAAAAIDGQRLAPGRVYVAVPNRHLMVQDGRIRLTRGPRECFARPSIDVLMRSAAYEFGERVIGVVMTGTLDDGTGGLWAIKDRGGLAIVQSPEEAAFPSMPRNALKHVRVDHVLRIADIAATISRLNCQPLTGRKARQPNRAMGAEIRIALGELAPASDRPGEPSVFTCPDCHGSMFEVREGTHSRYRCHTGHAFGDATLEERQATAAARALEEALALLDEREKLIHQAAAFAGKGGKGEDAERLAQQAAQVQDLRRRLHEVLETPVVEDNALRPAG
jgi:two-component system chemotaxis response regulator CheB